MRLQGLNFTVFALALLSCREPQPDPVHDSGLDADAAIFAGGEGTPEAPYLLLSCGHLQAMERDLAASYRLAGDIDCAGFDAGDGRGFRPVGSAEAPFAGTLDGDGHLVSGLSLDRPGASGGLFGAARGATVTQLGLLEVRVAAGDRVGAFVGSGEGVTLRQVLATGSVTGEREVGGLVGRLAGRLEDSYAAVAVGGASDIGNVIGVLDGGSIAYAYGAGEGGPAIGVEASGDVTSVFHDCDLAGACFHPRAARTDQLQDRAFLTAAGFDFVRVWNMRGLGHYPCLRWERECACEPFGDDASCDGADADCDGRIDEGFVPTPTTCGVGACASSGSVSCVAGSTTDTCVPAEPSGDDSACDGVDTDCDGRIDEGFVSSPTTCGAGRCAGTGTLECVDGAPTDTCGPDHTSPDTNCDGVDDDCDGRADESYEDGNPCTMDRCVGAVPSATPVVGTAECPVEPSDVATPLPPPHRETSFYESVAFLFEATPAIQRDVAVGAIVPRRAARVAGQVRRRGGGPMGGVKVSVVQQPEVGHTFTRHDGRFDLVVNGGGHLSLVFERPGFVTVHRTVRVEYGEHAFAPDVAVTPYDEAVTTVEFGAPGQQVHVATEAVDADGARTAAVVVPSGTTATMTLPDGRTLPLSDGALRVTELTVGPDGPDAMPALMPDHIAYTWAAELSLDEAVDAGATQVDFNQPVYLYLENFLGFDPGTVVPVGWYDRQRGGWVPSDDGAVIHLLGVDAEGRANVDWDGDGEAEAGSELAVVGFTDDERLFLASRYPEGTELWRAPIPHLTPWDCNTAVATNGTAPEETQTDPPDAEEPCEVAGSIVQCDNRTVAEELPIAGTGLALRYQSNRVPGDAESFHLRVAASDREPIPDRLFTDYFLSLAGRRIQVVPDEVDPTNPARAFINFDWDGLDWAGRRLSRPTEAVLDKEYVFRAFPATLRMGSGIGGVGRSFGSAAVAVRTAADRVGRTVTFRTGVDLGLVGVLDARAELGFGGLTLTSQHHLAETEGYLLRGDGTYHRRRGDGALTTLLRDALGASPHDGTLGPMDGCFQLTAFTVDPEGRVLVAAQERPGCAGPMVTGVWRLDHDGVLRRIVGNGDYGAWEPGHEGVDAASIPTRDIVALAFAPDGALYFADRYRIRRVTPDGVVRTVVGRPSPPPVNVEASDAEAGEGRPGTEVPVSTTALDVAPDGRVLFYNNFFSRQQVLTLDGRVETLAGGAGPGAPTFFSYHFAEGQQARSFNLAQATGPAVWLPNGEIVFAVQSRLIRVDNNGVVHPITGAAPEPPPYDGKPAAALAGNYWIHDLAVDADGAIYFRFATYGAVSVYRIASDGVLRRVLGGGRAAGYYVGTSAFEVGLTSYQLFYTEMEFGPDGNLYLLNYDLSSEPHADWGHVDVLEGHAIFEHHRSVVSADGAERYVFDDAARHIETRDVATGALLQRFAYDTSGRLQRIEDAHGNAVQVHYAPGEVRFVAPFGETTVVELGADGWAQRVYYEGDPDPTAVSTFDLSDAPGREGLLDAYTDRRGNLHRMSYDARGRLELDEHVAMGGSWRLATSPTIHTEDYAERSVTVTSAGGRSHIHRVRRYENERQEREVVAPDGTSTLVETVGEPPREATVTTPDGTVRSSTFLPDPLYGTGAMNLASAALTLPSGASTAVRVDTEVEFATGSLQIDRRTVTLTRNVGVSGAERVSATVSERQPDGSTVVTATSAEGRRIRSVYDPDGLLTELALLLPDGTPAFAPTSFSYDARGRQTQVRRGSGPNARVFTTHYTDADLPITAPERGYPLGVEDGEGDISTFSWDASLPRLLEATRPDGETTEFGYDVMGQVTRVRPPGRDDHRMSFDGYEALASYEPPALPSGATPTRWTSGVDRGQLDRVDLPDGRAIELHHDASTGRLLSAQLTSLPGAITYGYDAAGRVDTVTMPQLDASPVTTTAAFDGPLQTTESVTGAPLPTLTWSYDAADELRLRSLTVGSEPPIAWTYDRDGLLTGAGALRITRDPATGIAQSVHAGDVTTSLTPNTYGEPARIATRWTGGELSFDFRYDRAGRIVERTETTTSGARLESYAYDGQGRLVDAQVDGVPTYHYDYDGNGNRTGWVTPSGACVPAPGAPCVDLDAQDRLVRYGSTTFAYNALGQLTERSDSRGLTRYTYDELGNLRRVVLPDGRVLTYLIDGLGRRIGRLVDGVPDAYWVYGDALNPVAQLDGAGNIAMVFVYGTKPHVPDLIEHADGRTLVVVSDQVGSVRRVVDAATGAVVQRLDYSPFGVIERDQRAPGFDQPFRFAGGLWDADTGLLRFGARDYDPELGRWTAKDPIGFAGGDTNLYAYVGSDPVNALDRTGLDAEGWLAAANWLDSHGVDDFAAGFGDTVSFGLSAWIRDLGDGSGTVDTCSTAYTVGEIAAYVHGLLSGAAAARAARVAARGAGQASTVLLRTPRNLQKFFGKHGADFGLRGNWNPSRAADASRAIHQHINSPGVRTIQGAYRGNPATHYLDPSTGLNVVADPAGNFVTGYRVGANQLSDLLTTGHLF